MADHDALIERSGLTRRTALAGGSAALLTAALAACGKSSEDSSGGSGAGDFPETPKYRFTLVNHVTTNPFFVPTKYGADDACALLKCSYQWTGSKTADVGEMVNAMNTAISGKVDGIAVPLVDTKAFNGPTKKALDAGIPVLSYNADAPNERLAYIGQDLFQSGVEMGKRIVDLVPVGQGRPVHRHAGLAEHPAAHRRRDQGDQGLGQADRVQDRRHRRRAQRGALAHRRVGHRQQGRQGHVRRRRRARPRASARSCRSTSCATRA